ncbi:MAG: single-stranded-DNA-specific exonuclease RecJ [Candidatus Omnitrophica bacterium]|nr:single-stranded-DNA-specific exonuclease RecJ [Candidatus Omnitrophota bacterium]
MHSHKIVKVSPQNPILQEKLSSELKISKVIAQLLINRSIQNVEEARKFLQPNPKNLHDPFSFHGMEKAVSIIRKAIKNKEKIMVFGDYDVDGITAAALVKETIMKLGGDCLHYLPHRIKEGYGLSKDIANIVKEKKVKLLITVDCGTSNHGQIEELRHLGIEVVITDHHEQSSMHLPCASSIINPKTKASSYKFRDLAGVGVAYKLCQALTEKMLLDDLDLVSLGTIADSVSLTGENRIFAKEGLKRFPQTKREGLRSLIRNAGIENKKFTSTYISFILAPRINASGRMDSAELSLKLLMAKDREEADELAKALESFNRKRQQVESKILEEAQDLIEKEVNFKEHKIIVIAKEDWHQGVLGIVASKLADRFYRPAIVISLSENLCKGSARSIKNFHLFEALVDCKDLLDTFGGHSHAAGLLISKANIDDFRKSINKLANQKLVLEDLLPSIDIDVDLPLSDLNEKLVLQLEALEPFGMANPEPLFFTRNLKVKGQMQILNRATIKFWVSDGQITFPAIGFGMSSLKDSLLSSNSFDLVYSPRIDSWRGDSSIILEIRDIFIR